MKSYQLDQLDQRIKHKTVPDKRVIDDGKHDEDGVHGREGDEQHVERVVHVGLRQDDHAKFDEKWKRI